MKFGAKLGYLATWLGMFAAGSWIVPLVSVAAAPRVAVAAPMSDNSNDDGWTGSEVAQAWALATGSEYTPATQVLTMQSGADQVPARRSGAFRRREFCRALLVHDGTEPADRRDHQSGRRGQRHRPRRTCDRAGCRRTRTPGILLRYSGRNECGDGFGCGGSQQLAFAPFAAFQTEGDAVRFHEEMVEASQGGGDAGGGGGLFCVNPNWRGNNGVECCMFESAYQNGLKGCREAYWARFVACIAGALTATVGMWKLCLESCLYPCVAGPQACSVCTSGCFILGGVVGVGTVLACEFQNQKWYNQCILDKLGEYQSLLGANGCPPKPGAQGTAVLTGPEDAGILKSAETLGSEADE